MSFAVWDIIWIVIGSLYGIFAISWGVIMWRDRSWSLDPLLPPAVGRPNPDGSALK
jgi:hypothetical protein